MVALGSGEGEGRFGCAYERVAEAILVTEPFCILTVAVDTQIHTCDKNRIEPNTYTHRLTHTNECV